VFPRIIFLKKTMTVVETSNSVSPNAYFRESLIN
jgi:hypothetical protein